ncbi:MAG: ComEC/Rec2 family competence protein [Campylobacterales bacterium]|nr:ComEC/Rec2 family competence protein [Campylobacterales bacterium]
MKLEKINLLKSKKDYIYILLFFLFIFLINVFYEYVKYKEFKKNIFYENIYEIKNVYKKPNSFILKLKNKNMVFFTKVDKEYIKNTKIKILLITKNVDFLSYLNSFYTNIIFLKYIENENTIKKSILLNIKSQHKNKSISDLYSALFLGLGIDKNLRMKVSSFGISHLIAISGFHLGIISLVLYFILSLLYKHIHQNYFPYRNKSYDILVFIILILFYYLFLIDILASFLRALIMYIISLILLRSNIKLFSFTTLLFTFLFIVSFFPRFIFSLSLFFSLAGVFFIFLYIQYFKHLNKVFSFILFNIWIFAALNPIIHLFFPLSSLYQLYSPLLSLLFVLFYPFVLFLHFISYGSLFDDLLIYVLDLEIIISAYKTNIYFFYFYIFLSFLSISNTKSFYLMNILLIIFNIHLFYIL